MIDRRITIQGAACRGEASVREEGTKRRPRRAGALALLFAGVLAAATLASCKAGRNGDGTIFFTFAPDMTITAQGLEDALHQLQELYRECLAGAWQRPCTAEEEAEIERMHQHVLDAKRDLNRN
jgi:hypothetical protein